MNGGAIWINSFIGIITIIALWPVSIIYIHLKESLRVLKIVPKYAMYQVCFWFYSFYVLMFLHNLNQYKWWLNDYICLQMVLILSQLQTAIVNILAMNGTIACAPPFTSQARGYCECLYGLGWWKSNYWILFNTQYFYRSNIIIQLNHQLFWLSNITFTFLAVMSQQLLIVEMFIITLVTRLLYRRHYDPLPEEDCEEEIKKALTSKNALDNAWEEQTDECVWMVCFLYMHVCGYICARLIFIDVTVCLWIAEWILVQKLSILYQVHLYIPADRQQWQTLFSKFLLNVLSGILVERTTKPW